MAVIIVTSVFMTIAKYNRKTGREIIAKNLIFIILY